MRTLPLLLLSATVCGAGVTPPEQITIAPGFKVELLREGAPGEGSWICMTQDDHGRLYLASQGGSFAKHGEWGGVWRVTLGKSAQSSVRSAQSGRADAANPKLSTEHWALSTPAEMKWDRVQVPVSDAMGMLWAFDSLYVSGMGPQGRGIYRCTSSKRDGNLDTATLFKAIPGGAGEHGAHAIVLGPDKKLYIVNGNSTGILDGLDPDSPYRNWGEDDLLPRLKDPVATFFDKIKAPYGCVYRTDADGTKWELFAGGFRNPYDIAFNPDGELFTYDSDMEWDRGLPWYRPTRILHIVPGGEYGFREGSAKWPAYFPDSLPAVADIGVGCPTGIKFGTGAKGWPRKYRRALYLLDWAYGRILAVSLDEERASYRAVNVLDNYTYPKDAEANCDVDVFLSGKGMPVTDVEFGKDGGMYFITGGRGTASALYRVSHIPRGEMGSWLHSFVPGSYRTIRRDLEEGRVPGEKNAVYWGEAFVERDPFIQFAAQSAGSVALPGRRFVPLDRIGLLDLLAKVRAGGVSQEKTLEALKVFQIDRLIPKDLKLLKLRILGLSFARQGRPSEESVKAVVDDLLAQYPFREYTALDTDKFLGVTRGDGPEREPLGRTLRMEEEVRKNRNPAAGAPVDDPAWRLNRELCALLTWLSNPELGALNADLAKADGAAKPGEPAKAPVPVPAKVKTGDFRPPTNVPTSSSDILSPLAAPNSGLGPVPNPGADIFPGRKGAAFHVELGRQVIEKTLGLMDAAPSQEEQIWYALCLRWAHGWTPEQRVRYFRWFREKASRYTGGNSFAKYIEAIRADAASRVPESERAALAE